jgi:membrane associated rhomboid family serine protease
MIPLSDNVRGRRFPLVTVLLIVVNTVIFLFELSLGPEVEALINSFGMIPARLVSSWTDPLVLLTLFTAMFLHGGLGHLIGNMLYLWIFGDNIEDRMGHGRFLIFYLFSGVLASLVEVVAAPTAQLPTVGASGAIAGVLGAYLLLFPQARIRVLIPIPLFFFVTSVPAVLVLGSWFLLQFYRGLMSMNVPMQRGGVAWWAHIGGFIAGMILMPIFRKKREEAPYEEWERGFQRWQ